jgi:hypothetical protein
MVAQYQNSDSGWIDLRWCPNNLGRVFKAVVDFIQIIPPSHY